MTEELLDNFIGSLANSGKAVSAADAGDSPVVLPRRQPTSKGTVLPSEFLSHMRYEIREILAQRRCPCPLSFQVSNGLVNKWILEYANEADAGKIESEDSIKRTAQALVTEFTDFMKDAGASGKAVHHYPFLSSHYGSESPFQFSACAIKNDRRGMEDASLALPSCSLWSSNESLAKDALFAVFDGHGGPECANYAVTHLLRQLERNIAEHVLTSEHLGRTISSLEDDIMAKCQRDNLRSGAAGVVLWLRPESTVGQLAWLGDCNALLLAVDGAQPRMLCKPVHNTADAAECDAIARRGGILLDVKGLLRVNGMLPLTRCFGDASLKPPLTAEPGLVSIDLDRDNQVVVLASDGLWDGLRPDQVDRLVHILDHLAEHLANQARKGGSTDNTSVIVVFLHPVSQVKRALV